MFGEAWCVVNQEWPGSVEEQEVIERENWPASIPTAVPVRSNADPGHATIDAMRGCLGADASDANYGIERPIANPPHAPVDAESSAAVGVASVRAFVNECAHSMTRRTEGSPVTPSNSAAPRSRADAQIRSVTTCRQNGQRVAWGRIASPHSGQGTRPSGRVSGTP